MEQIQPEADPHLYCLTILRNRIVEASRIQEDRKLPGVSVALNPDLEEIAITHDEAQWSFLLRLADVSLHHIARMNDRDTNGLITTLESATRECVRLMEILLGTESHRFQRAREGATGCCAFCQESVAQITTLPDTEEYFLSLF
jgi:hypothetical protein